MSNAGLTLKREAATQAWAMLIDQATGSRPYITRYSDGVKIAWREGQAAKMRNYLAESMEAEESPDDLNVDVDLLPVIGPLAVKKGWKYFAAYSAGLIFLGWMLKK